MGSNGSNIFEGLAENFAIEKENGTEGLILSGGSYFALGGEVGNEGFDFGNAHVSGMAFVMKENEPLCPFYIGVFSAIGVVLGSKGVPHLVEEFFPLRGRCALRLKGRGVLDCHMDFEQCIIVKTFLINHQVGRSRDVITIFFPINSRTRVFSGL